MNILRKLVPKKLKKTIVSTNSLFPSFKNDLIYRHIELDNKLTVCFEDSPTNEKCISLSIGGEKGRSELGDSCCILDKGTVKIEYDHLNINIHLYNQTSKVEEVLTLLRNVVLYQLQKEEFKISIPRPIKSQRDLVLTTAFGLKGLGLPLNGLDVNQNDAGYQLHAEECMKFLSKSIGSDKCLLTFSGYDNHKQLVNACEEILDPLNPVLAMNDDIKISNYLGGVCKLHSKDTKKTHIKAYQSIGLPNPKSILIELIPFIKLSDSRFSEEFVQKFQSFSKMFSHCSIYGAQLSEFDQSLEESEQIIDEYFAMLATRVSPSIFNYSKECLLHNYNEMMQSPHKRLEILSKSFFHTKSLDYLERMRALKTYDDSSLSELLSSAQSRPSTTVILS